MITTKISQDNEYLECNNMFQTSDLGLATCLVSLDYDLWNLDKANPKKVQFIFRRTDDINLIINNYWQNDLKINARTLFDNQKMLKNRIYSN